jgi:tetratricopeptide (TPR) repeat protein
MLALSPDFIPARYERAALAAQEARFEEAQRDIDIILAAQPAHLPAGMLRAQLLTQAGRDEEALLAHQQLAARFPHSIPAGMAAARLLVRRGNTEAALRQLDDLLNVHPGYREAALMWAELSIARGDYPPALARLATLDASDAPTRTRSLALAGLAHRRNGNSFAAVTTYDELAKLLPGDPQPRYLAGLTHREAERFDAAEAFWLDALKVDPLHFPSLQALVSLRLEQGAFATADELIQRSIRAHGEHAGLLYLQAAIAIIRDDIPVAERSLRRAIELQPDFMAAYRDLGRLYVRAGRVDDALRKLTSALEANEGDLTTLMMLATLLQQTGRDDEAITRYEQILARHGDFPGALNSLAYLYGVRGEQPARALQLAQRARELAPREPAVADTLGMIALQHGMARWAYNLLMECAVPLAHDPEVMHHLARACLAMGREDEAREHLARALATDEEFPGRSRATVLADVLRLPLEAVNETHAGDIAHWMEAMPSEPPVLARVAALEMSRGNMEAALAAHQHALDIRPEYVPSLAGMARIQLRQGNTSAALDTARRARAMQSGSPALTMLLGQAAYQSGDYPWALSLLGEAVKELPRDAAAHFHHGLAALMSGRIQEAHASAAKAFQLTPVADDEVERRRLFVQALEMYATRDGPPITEVAMVWADREDDPWLGPLIQLVRARFAGNDAEVRYRALMDRYPGWPLPSRDWVSLRIASGQVDEPTLQHAREVRERMPDNHRANRNYALALAMSGQMKPAAFYLKQYLALAPDDREAATWLEKVEVALAP